MVAARDGDELRMRTALEALCRTYWYPLYAFVRARGCSAHDAEDLVQAFFHRLIEKNGLRHVHPAKGRFRHFLLASIKHFLANEWDRAQTLKRGGNHQVISLDQLQAAERHAAEYSDDWGPDVLYDRRWALAMLDGALGRLRRDYASGGKAAVFEVLKECLTPGAATSSYAELGERLGKSPEAIAVEVHRLRSRYRECVREEIAETVADPREVESELVDLRRILGG